MTGDGFKRAEAAHAADLKSTAPATRGYVTQSVDALAAAIAKAMKAEIHALRRQAESTGQLLADIDLRLAAIEDRLAELDR